jgi:hypothetical protein
LKRPPIESDVDFSGYQRIIGRVFTNSSRSLETGALPAWTARIVSATLPQHRFQQVPRAPALKAREAGLPGGRQSDNSGIGELSANCPMASIPFISGICRSISVMSG